MEPTSNRSASEPPKYRIAYEQALNPSQLEAVMFGEGSVLVIAGAGSGKTRTLTYRVARLVEEGVDPRSVLLLTFTRKAAQEMLERSVQLLDHRCGKVSGGTFHSFANHVLRRYASRIGYTDGFSIMDRADAESLIGLLRKEVRPVAAKRSFPTSRALANIFSKAVNKSRSIEEIVREDYPHFSADIEAVGSLHRLYGQHKVQNRFFDYDDLLIQLKRLLETDTETRDRIRSAFDFIMVDEYQDTNKIQAQILFLLAGTRRNIMAVGDDAQSIYSFRGASFENIMSFPEMFPGTRVIRLEENYRSTQPILDLTNAIQEGAARKYAKHLFTRRTGGVPPLLVNTPDENGQSQFVVEKIRELTADGVPPNQIAVLFRAGFHSFDLEIELNRAGLPFVKVGGFKFMESAHIKDVLAHLRIVANPFDRVSWYRILNLLDGVGPKSAAAVYQAVAKDKEIPEALKTLDLKPALKKRLTRLAALYDDIDIGAMTVARAGEVILDYYAPLLARRYDDHPRRMKDLEQLIVIMGRYERLERFLTDMALEPPTSTVDDTMSGAPGEEERLILSTVHSAKGLEWHTVFVIWALEGRFPSVHALDKEEEIEEELRLMYVAATRAREQLYFTCPGYTFDRGANRMLTGPSRFIEGIAEDLLERRYLALEGWTDWNF